MEVLFGILIPFIGTTLGSACVFFMKRSLGGLVQRALAGFAAGVMVAASIWSLLIPAIEQSEDMGKLSFLPAFIGFWSGVLSGVVEPIGAVLTLLAAQLVIPATSPMCWSAPMR